jgi:hypothetical protein
MPRHGAVLDIESAADEKAIARAKIALDSICGAVSVFGKLRERAMVMKCALPIKVILGGAFV